MNLSYSSSDPSLPIKVVYNVEKETDYMLIEILSWKKSQAHMLHTSSVNMTRIVELIYVFARKANYKDKMVITNKKVTDISKMGQKMYHSSDETNFIEAKSKDKLEVLDGLTCPTISTFSIELVTKLLKLYHFRSLYWFRNNCRCL